MEAGSASAFSAASAASRRCEPTRRWVHLPAGQLQPLRQCRGESTATETVGFGPLCGAGDWGLRPAENEAMRAVAHRSCLHQVSEIEQ